MLHIYIDTIPHSEQRYETVGDYWRPAGNHPGFIPRLEVRVSEMGNEDYEFLVAIHELVEEHLTRKHGISEDTITAFDIQYEQNRAEDDTNSEPGDSPDAPYHQEHLLATSVERIVASMLGVNWDTYDAVVNSLDQSKESV